MPVAYDFLVKVADNAVTEDRVVNWVSTHVAPALSESPSFRNGVKAPEKRPRPTNGSASTR